MNYTAENKQESLQDMEPIFSIVIVNFNYGRFLEAAIRSVVDQDGFDECELIVVDGGSTDNSVEIIKKYADRIAWWVSEKDKGQSDAFNKGFAHARGKLGCWVNADDLLLPGTLRTVLGHQKKHPECEWITGGVVFFNDQMKIWKMRIGTWITRRMHRWVDPTVIGGPSSFFSLSRLKEVGGFNVRLHYTMDGDLWNKFFAAGMRMVHLPRYFWGFRMHAASKTTHSLTDGRNDAFLKEDELVFSRGPFTRLQVWLSLHGLGPWKLLNGSILRSYFDTMRMKGKDIRNVDL